MSARGPAQGQGHFHVTAVKTSDVLMRFTDLPPTLAEEEIAAAIAFQEEEALPFSAQEAAVVSFNRANGLYFATKRERLPEGPFDAAIPTPLALLHFISHFSLPATFLLIYADEEEVTLMEIRDKAASVCTYLKRGEDLEKEFARRLQAYKWHAEMPVLLLGERVLTCGEEICLENRFGLASFDLHAKALFIGLCLLPFALPIERFDLGHKKVAFRKIPLFKPLLVSLLTLAALFFATEEWLSSKERLLFDKIQSQDIEGHIQEMRNQLTQTGFPFPLKPQLPAFSDLLAWISAQAPEGVQIDKISYNYLSSPTLKNPKERYVVQVDISFMAPSTAVARLFHERLTAAESLVAQDAYFVWQSSERGYKVSFRLKDRTVYELS